jgi:hypothetical protein
MLRKGEWVIPESGEAELPSPMLRKGVWVIPESVEAELPEPHVEEGGVGDT